MGGVFSKTKDTFRENRTRNPVCYEKKNQERESDSWELVEAAEASRSGSCRGVQGANGMPGLACPGSSQHRGPRRGPRPGQARTARGVLRCVRTTTLPND